MAATDDDAWLEFLARGVARRRALVGFLCALALVAFVLESLAISPLAYVVYEGLGLGWLWPAVVFLLAAIYLGAGVLSHRLNGLPQFFPFLALLALAAMTLAAGRWLLVTAAEWSSLEVALALILLGAAAVPAAIGLFAYCELWRVLWNRGTVRAVLRTLPGGEEGWPEAPAELVGTARPESRFHKITETQKKSRMWGSPHCLQIVEGAYTVRKRRAVDSADHGMPTEAYDLCLDTGDDLFLYLRLRWPGDHTSWKARILDLLRELITIWLQGTREQRKPHQARANQWKQWIEKLGGKSSDPYYRFLALCFGLGRGVHGVNIPERIEEALSLYRALPDDRKPRNRRLICQNTWLVLAHRSIAEQPCYDAWMAMRRIQGQGPLLTDSDLATTDSDPDVALVLARKFLSAHYHGWKGETHEDWRQGLAGWARISVEIQEERWPGKHPH